jgi:hypothetical protein
MRDLTPLIIQATTPSTVDGAVVCSDLIAVNITLKDGTVLRVAQGEITVSSVNAFGVSTAVVPVSYTADVRGVPNVRFSEGRAPDGGDLLLQNMTNLYSPLIGQLNRVFDSASVVLYDCFKKPDGTYEADPIFVGKVRDVRGDEELVRLSIVVDYAVRTALVANRQLTQKCLADFGDDRCGYPKLPGQVCSKIYDDAEAGCLFWDWQEYFWGAPSAQFTAASTTDPFGDIGGGNTGGDGTGFGNGGFPRPNPRFDPDHQMPTQSAV